MGFIKTLFIIILSVCLSGSGSAKSATRPALVNTSVEAVSLNKSEARARAASVVVRDPIYGSYGSGTLFKIRGRNIVITAAHVVDGHQHMQIIGRANESVMGTVIYVDPNYDFAMITIPDMISVEPMRFRPYRGDVIGKDVAYTGHPAHHELLTVRGRVAGVDRSSNMILMHSYAWMGASGSCVFTLDGKLVGVLVAVDVGRYDGRQIVEDIVWLTPISEIDLDQIMLTIQVHGRR